MDSHTYSPVLGRSRHLSPSSSRIVSSGRTPSTNTADPIVLSAAQLIAGEEETICGGIDVDFSARAVDGNRLALSLIVSNLSDDPWRGTIDLELGRARVPISIGRVAGGTEEVETIVLNLDEGESDIVGSLLIGP